MKVITYVVVRNKGKHKDVLDKIHTISEVHVEEVSNLDKTEQNCIVVLLDKPELIKYVEGIGIINLGLEIDYVKYFKVAKFVNRFQIVPWLKRSINVIKWIKSNIINLELKNFEIKLVRHNIIQVLPEQDVKFITIALVNERLRTAYLTYGKLIKNSTYYLYSSLERIFNNNLNLRIFREYIFDEVCLYLNYIGYDVLFL